MQRGQAWRVGYTKPGGGAGLVIVLDEPTTIVTDLTARGYTGVTVTPVPLVTGYGDLAAIIDRDEVAEAREKARQVLTPVERQLLGLGF
jgi:hypothetical protein